MTMFERSHLASNLWRFVIQFGFCCLAAHSVFAATKPVISDKNGLSPSSAVAGSGGFILTVSGTYFNVADETVSVNWNGSPRPIISVRAAQLQVTIFASDIAVPGTAQVTISNTDQLNSVATSDPATFTIVPAPLVINTTSLPNGLLNVSYSQSLSASGGIPPYTWSITSGSLPAGLNLNAFSGTLAGTPTSSGSFTFTIRVQDSAQPMASASKQFTLAVQNPVPAITGISPNSAIAGSPQFALTVNGSNFVSGSKVRWNGSDRTTSLSSATSLTASIPASDIATAGTASVTVNNPAPGGGPSNALSFTISAAPIPTLNITTTSPLPIGIVDSPYSQQFSASGGTPPYHWLVSSGSLPPGLSLTPGTGALGGTPSATGDFSFTLKISDSTQPTPSTSSKAFALRINNPVPVVSGLNPSSVSAGGPGFNLTVNGSNFISGSTVTWNGLNRPTTFINSSQLTASIPSGDIVLAGSASVAVVNPSPGGGTSSALTFLVSPAGSNPTISSSSPLPNGFLGAAYSQSLSASGGTPPYTWEVQSGSLPNGLTLNSTTGVISGTASSAGTFQFTIKVLDSASSSSSKSFQLLINPLLPEVSISGPADVLTPAQQPTVQLSLAEAYPSSLSGQMTLVFTPDADEPSDDPAIQFSTGGRMVGFTIPPNSAQAVFPNSAAEIAFQSGTVSGAIKISVSLQSEGTDVTPSPAPSRTFTVSRSAPVITSLNISSRSTSGFEIELIGFSTPRSLTQLDFRFTPRSGSNLGTTTFTLPLGPSSTTWFQSATSKEFGSSFRLVIPFTVQGDVNAIQSISATLSNAVGASNSMSINP